MKQDDLVYIAAVALISTIVTVPVFSQEAQKSAADISEKTIPTQEGVIQPEEIYIYGEIQSVNASSNIITIKYYNYDTDEEKTIEIISGKDTKIENVASLNDLKQGDWVDVIYVIGEGKNIAKTVKVEKEEKNPEETASDNRY